MKTKIALIALLMLGGCDKNMFIAQANFLCKDHGGVHHGNLVTGAYCADNTWYSSRIIKDTIIADPAYYPEKDNTHEEPH